MKAVHRTYSKVNIQRRSNWTLISTEFTVCVCVCTRERGGHVCACKCPLDTACVLREVLYSAVVKFSDFVSFFERS